MKVDCYGENSDLCPFVYVIDITTGSEIKHCVMADEEKKEYETWAYDKKGAPILDQKGQEIVRNFYRGSVKIIFQYPFNIGFFR